MAPMDMRKRYSKGKRKKTEAEPSQWKKYYRNKNVKIQIIKIVICGKNSTEKLHVGRNRFEPQNDQNLLLLVTVFQIGITDGAFVVS